MTSDKPLPNTQIGLFTDIHVSPGPNGMKRRLHYLENSHDFGKVALAHFHRVQSVRRFPLYGELPEIRFHDLFFFMMEIVIYRSHVATYYHYGITSIGLPRNHWLEETVGGKVYPQFLERTNELTR